LALSAAQPHGVHPSLRVGAECSVANGYFGPTRTNSERARLFYLQHGFMESTFDSLTVMLDLGKAEAALKG
jgi:hypothetical protein